MDLESKQKIGWTVKVVNFSSELKSQTVKVLNIFQTMKVIGNIFQNVSDREMRSNSKSKYRVLQINWDRFQTAI